MKRQLAVLATVSLLALAAAAPALALETVAPAAAATDAGAIQAPPLQYRERTLANGLRVLSIQDRSSPTVSTQMWYNVGSKDDPQGRSGFAHLFEHVMSRQTRNIPRGYINQLVEDVGGARNASTSSDWTNYYEVVPSQYLETMLWTHAERMDRLVVDESVFNAERDIVKEELRQRVLAEPYGRLQRYVIPENSFRVSPYHRSGIGSIEQLNAATIDDARAFHDTF
ncbi:MAG TPA: pitrilysin family protein, partial [Caulobacteraceae bacterium]